MKCVAEWKIRMSGKRQYGCCGELGGDQNSGVRGQPLGGGVRPTSGLFGFILLVDSGGVAHGSIMTTSTTQFINHSI